MSISLTKYAGVAKLLDLELDLSEDFMEEISKGGIFFMMYGLFQIPLRRPGEPHKQNVLHLQG